MIVDTHYPWIRPMDIYGIHGYLWSICHIWVTLVGAAATTHQCTTALCKPVELINLTPPLNKNTPWWIWTRIYWNTISSAFPWNITLIYYSTVYAFIECTVSHFLPECYTEINLVLNKLTNLLTGQEDNVYGRSVKNTYHTHLWASKILTVVGVCEFHKKYNADR